MEDSQHSYELVRAIAHGSEEAMLEFYDEHFGIVAGFCRRMIGDRGVADEVIQDVFWQVWRQASSYVPERGSILAWILTIARSRVIDAIRRLQRSDWVALEQSDLDGVVNPQRAIEGNGVNSVELAVEHNFERQRIVQALNDLPPPQRDVLYRIHFEGRTAKEVAEHDKVPLGTIKTRLRLGLEKLHKVLEVKTDDA